MKTMDALLLFCQYRKCFLGLLILNYSQFFNIITMNLFYVVDVNIWIGFIHSHFKTSNTQSLQHLSWSRFLSGLFTFRTFYISLILVFYYMNQYPKPYRLGLLNVILYYLSQFNICISLYDFYIWIWGEYIFIAIWIFLT